MKREEWKDWCSLFIERQAVFPSVWGQPLLVACEMISGSYRCPWRVSCWSLPGTVWSTICFVQCQLLLCCPFPAPPHPVRPWASLRAPLNPTSSLPFTCPPALSGHHLWPRYLPPPALLVPQSTFSISRAPVPYLLSPHSLGFLPPSLTHSQDFILLTAMPGLIWAHGSWVSCPGPTHPWLLTLSVFSSQEPWSFLLFFLPFYVTLPLPQFTSFF